MSGYPLDSFVDPIDEALLCRICRRVLNSPRKTPCGHVFCLSCLSSWIEYYGVCPNRCGDVELIELTHPFDIEERVFGLLKRCKYFSIGCRKQGRLADIEQHEKVCTYQHCDNRQQQPTQLPTNPEEMKKTIAPSLDCLFGRFGKAKKRPSTNAKPSDIQTRRLMQTELTFRLKRNKTTENLGLVLVSGSKNSDGNAEYFLVKEVHAGTLASKAGVFAGDRIVQVDGVVLGRMNPGEAVARIKDKTLVTVTVVRGEKPTSHSHKEHIYDEILYSDASQFSLSQPEEMFASMSLEPPELHPPRHSPQGPRRARVPLAPDDPYGPSGRSYNHDHVQAAPPPRVGGQHHVEGSKDSGLSSGSNDSARLVHRQMQKVAEMQQQQQQQQQRSLKYSQQMSLSQDLLSRATPARHSYRTEREMMRNGALQEARSNSQDMLATTEASHRRNCRVEGNYELEEIYIQKNGTNQLGITLEYGAGQLLVCDVVPGGLAAMDGRIKKGDIIRMVNGFSVVDPEEAVLLFLEQDQDITLTVARKMQHLAMYDDRRNFRRIDSCGSLDSHTSESRQYVSRKPSNNSEDGYVHMNGRDDLAAALPENRVRLLPTRRPQDPLPPARRTFDDPQLPTRRAFDDPLPPTRRDPLAPLWRAPDETTPLPGLQQHHHPSAFFRPIADDHRPRTAEHPLIYSQQQSRPMTTTPPMKHKTSVQLSAPPSAVPNGHIYGELEPPHYGYMRTESLV